MIVSVNWIGPVHLRNWELNHLPLKLRSSNGSILYFLNPNIVFDGHGSPICNVCWTREHHNGQWYTRYLLKMRIHGHILKPLIRGAHNYIMKKVNFSWKMWPVMKSFLIHIKHLQGPGSWLSHVS